MAKVKIQGNASGTGVLTVTAPNTSTDRTITLPDSTGTIATTTDVAARLPSITDGGNATAITITSTEYIGVGTASPLTKLNIVETAGGAAGIDLPITISSDRYQADYGVGIGFRPENNSGGYKTKAAIIASGGGYGYGQADLHFCIDSDNTVGNEVGLSDSVMTLKKDGRGLSQFTAKAWVNFNGTGTPATNDSHNVSSLTDQGVGRYDVNFTNNMADGNYSAVYDARSVNNNAGNASYVQTYSTSFLQVKHYENGTNYDPEVSSVIVFGD